MSTTTEVPLKVMAFNIWHGGRLDGSGDDLSAQNVAQLLEFVRSEDPDLLFLVETYGTGRQVEQALNRAQPAGRTFRGIQLTRQPDRPPDKDNLWLFTWLPVAQVHPIVTTGLLTSFNFGGAHLLLPDGSDLHAFTVWLHHLDSAVEATTQAVMEHALGLEPAATSDQIVAADHARRLPMAQVLLDRLRTQVPDDSATVILGGDFNTLSHLDWSAAHTHARGHGGLALDWPVMRKFEVAGFTDTYRHANPDPVSHPGDTQPGLTRRRAPARIDYVLTRGARVDVVGSSRRTRRLRQHRGGVLDRRYPFYSDHAALVTELVLGGPEPRPQGPPHPAEPPEPPPRAVPPPPAGRPVPAAEVSASATTATPGSDPALAVDDDPRTAWVVDEEVVRTGSDGPGLTLDLGRVRTLSAVRYQPPLCTRRGTILRYSLWAGTDGNAFTRVAAGDWIRDQLPDDIVLPDVPARWLRLVSHRSDGGAVAVAELTVFEGGPADGG